MPKKPTAIGTLSRAIKALEDAPMEPKITPAVERMFDFVGPELPLAKRMVMANRWLFGSMLARKMSKSLSGANVRTTVAPTIISAGLKENVLPSHAVAVVNFRILTGQTINDVLEHAQKVINDPLIEIRTVPGASEPTTPRMIEEGSFKLLARTIRQIFPDAKVAPGLVVGMTDSRHFDSLGDAVYRFSPIVVKPEDLKRFHGTDERVAVDNYIEAIHFYRQLILNLNKSNERK
jgi:carboxypeptidase PM20D1